MISYALQLVGITLFCVAAYIVHPVIGLACTGTAMIALGVSLERSRPTGK